MSITIHDKFMTFGLDLGYFDEVIWKISKGIFPYSGVGCIWFLEDHFQPILYLIAPFYWIWENVRVILIIQSFFMVFAGLPLYILAKKVTHNIFFSFSIVIAYLFFIGTQFAILNEFHQIIFAPLFIVLMYYSLEIKNLKIYFLTIFVLLLIKEDLTLFILAVGLGLIFRKPYRRLGIITSFIGFISFLLLLYVVMPRLSVKGVYSHFDFGPAGFTPFDIILKSVSDPIFFVKSMIFPTIKVKTLLISFATYSFIPLLAGVSMLIPLIQDIVVRFIYAGPQFTKWSLVNHHATVSAILLAIGAVYGGKKIVTHLSVYSKSRYIYNYLGIFIIGSTIAADFIFHGPVNSLLKIQFYEKEKWTMDNNEVLLQVPEDASVAAQNNLLPHLTHRENIYRIPYGLNSEYMVIDLHDGPNKYAPLSYTEMNEFVDDLIATNRYTVIYQKGKAMLLKRNYKTDITKSKYDGDTRYCYYSLEER